MSDSNSLDEVQMPDPVVGKPPEGFVENTQTVNNTTEKDTLDSVEVPDTWPKNTEQTFATTSSLTEDPAKVRPLLSLPTDTTENRDKAIANMPNIDFSSTTDGNEWANILKTATYTQPYRDWFMSTVKRPDAMFKQFVQSEQGILTAAAPKFNDAVNSKLTGERAVIRVKSLLGLGSVVQIPLWHSGFWISIKAPSEAALLELNRRLAEEKITLGRRTYGLAYANTSVFFAGWVMDFAIAHIYSTTLKPELEADIRKHISVLDIPIIAWGLACAIWPKGFAYARAVLDQEKEPNKVIREKLELGKILWVDNTSLSPWQISHMANRFNSSMTTDNLERYRTEFTRGKGRTFELVNDCQCTLKVPTLDQYLISGQKWVNGIVSMVDQTFGRTDNEEERDSFILDQGKASNMRQFAHWVESLSISSNVIDDVETLEQSLDALSSDDDIRGIYFKEIRKYIEDSTMSIVAIPVTEVEEKGPLPHFPHLLPLDALHVFFILLVQKSTMIQDRQ